MKTKLLADGNPVSLHTYMAMGALLGMLFTSVIFLFPSNSSNRGEQWQEVYAQSLANLTAKQATTSIFTSDLIGLQILLQDVSEQPKVILAATYDIENTVLAQAGSTRFDAVNTANAIAAIVVDDSIAGYVSVTVQSGAHSSLARVFLLTITAILLACLSIWGVIKTKTFTPFRQDAGITKAHSESSAQLTNSNSLETDESSSPELDHVIAIIHVKNMAVIHGQLSGDSFRNTLSKFERILHDVLALYGGARCEREDNCYILSFAISDNRDETLFKAICSAYLVLELGGIVNDVPLDLAALVSIDHGEELDSRPLPIAGLHIDESVSDEDIIEHRLKIMNVDNQESRKVVAGFAQPFQTLLENQRNQLALVTQND